MTINNPRDPQVAEIAAAASRLTGSPEQLAERLRALLDAGAPKAAARESTDTARERMVDTRRHEVAVAALRQRLADDFATLQGWRPTVAPLSTKEIARRTSPGGKWHRRANEWSQYLPHATFYRGSDNRAAAAVGHPPTEVIEGNPLLVEMWAAEHGLTLSLPDFPSWQHPGRTRLVLFASAEPVQQPAPAPEAEGVGQASAVAELEQPRRVSHGVGKRDIRVPVLDVAPADPAGADPIADRAGQDSASEPVAKIDMGAPEQAASDAGPAPRPDEVDSTEPAPPTAPDLPSMRPVAPIDLAGTVPRDLAGEIGPDFDIVAPAELMVDEQYQRNLGPRSLDLIRRIVAGWSWSKFKPPICTRVDGALHVIDGQHTAIGAASHGGIPVIPVVVVPVPEVSGRAAAFVSHAKDRLAATALQVHRAALVAGDPEAVTLDAVCRRAGVELLTFAPSDGRYTARQCVAVVGLQRLIAKCGVDRAAEVLGALAAADLVPISGDHIRLGEVLLCDPAYAESFDAEKLTAAMRGLTAKTHAEARELAIAQRLPAWRALAAVLARNSRTASSRRRATA